MAVMMPNKEEFILGGGCFSCGCVLLLIGLGVAATIFAVAVKILIM